MGFGGVGRVEESRGIWPGKVQGVKNTEMKGHAKDGGVARERGNVD